MIIKANEIEKYMKLHNVDKVPVEVLNTDVPENKELRQGTRKLAKRLIITDAHTGRFGGFGRRAELNRGVEAVNVNYVMYNSFKKSGCYLPPDWEFEILAGEIGKKVLEEYNNHSSNLEQHFREVFAKHNPEIQKKLEEAAKLIKEAEEISEQHGIPFSPQVDIMDGMPTGFVPKSFDSIYGELRQDDETNEIIGELTRVYYHDYTGWQNSSSSC